MSEGKEKCSFYFSTILRCHIFFSTMKKGFPKIYVYNILTGKILITAKINNNFTVNYISILILNN